MEFAVAGITLHPLIPFFWALFVGLVFSMVGAAGGILAGVGHITLFGIAHANMVKPMNQLLVIASPLIAVPAYLRQGRILPTLGVLLGVGSIFGSIIGSWYSKNYLQEMRHYQPLFGMLVLFIALRLFYETTDYFRQGHGKVRETSRAFEARIKESREGGREGDDPEILMTDLSFQRLSIFFFGQEFACHPGLPVLAGFFVAFISAALGVGGGFLLVPFMASWLELPMFIVAGTSALAVLIASVTSVANYLYLGVQLDWPLALIELAGTVIGSLLGPWVSRYMKERWLRAILALVLLYVGFGYTFGKWTREWLKVSII